MQSNMIDKGQEQFHGPGVRVPTLLRWAIYILSMIGPMLLVIYAFGASDDAVERAHLVVSGCKTLTLMLVGATALAAFYQLGVEAGVQATRQDSDAMGRPVTA